MATRSARFPLYAVAAGGIIDRAVAAAMNSTPSLPISPEVAILGGGLCVALCVLFGVLARQSQTRWPRWVATAYGSYAVVLMIWLLQPLGGRAELSALAPFVAVPYVLLSVGIWQHTAAPGRRVVDLGLVALGVFVVAVVLATQLLPMKLAPARSAAGAVWTMWAWRFLQAARREPGQGQAVNAWVCCVYPVLLMLGPIEWLPVGARRVPMLVPTVALGVSLLVTSLLRMQRAEAQARQEAAQSLQQRLALEATMQRMNSDIEVRMASQFSALNETVTELESFNRQVSHDLRGPLGAMAKVSQLARDRIAAGDHDSALRMLDVLQRQSQLSFEAVDALLWLARSTQGPLRLEVTDVRQLVDELAQLLVEEDALPAGALTTRDLPTVMADAALLRQLFRNLLVNASKFRRPDVPLQVAVQAQQEAGQWVFELRDNGRGFDAADAERIFKPFERAGASGARSDGIGVGLSIVQRIVERHGGWVRGHGEPGAGALFRFTLGRHEMPATAPTNAPTEARVLQQHAS